MKELEDHAWFPQLFRKFQTEFIGFAVKVLQIYQPFIQYLRSQQIPHKWIWDLCSGSGEPAQYIYAKTNSFSGLILSDKYPVALTKSSSIIYKNESVDVLALSFDKEYTYTMFNAFHHFTDEKKQEIVARINRAQASAYFVEILEPALWCLIKIVLMTTIGVILLTPFIKPFSIWRIFFTYLLPINILTIFIDGIISVFKSRSVKQYQQLFKGLDHVRVKRLSNLTHSITLIEIHSPE